MKRFLKILSFLLFSAFLSANTFAYDYTIITIDYVDRTTSQLPIYPKMCKYGDTANCRVPENVFTPEGMVFLGWQCINGCDDPEKIYKPGDDISTIIQEGNIVLSAQYLTIGNIEEYTVKFQYGMDVEQQICNMAAPCYIPNLLLPSESGEYIIGWELISNPDKIYLPGEDISSELRSFGGSTITFAPVTGNYPIFYIEYLSEIEPDEVIQEEILPTQCTYDQKNCFAPENPYIVNGARFVGWLCSSDSASSNCDGKIFQPGDDLSTITNYDGDIIRLQALWEFYESYMPYTINFDYQDTGNTILPEVALCNYGIEDEACVALPAPGPEYESREFGAGAQFTGWMCQSETQNEPFCDGKIFQPGDDLSMIPLENDNLIWFRAVWKPGVNSSQNEISKVTLITDCGAEDTFCYSPIPETFYIEYNKGGYYDSALLSPITNNKITIPAKYGYKFTGYVSRDIGLAIDGGGNFLASLMTQNPMPTETILMATWEKQTCNQNERLVDYTTKVACTACPKNSSNASDKHTNTTCTCNTGYSLNGSNKAGETTIDQDCSANRYTISYVLNGGTQASSGVPTSYSYDTRTTINGTPTPQTGYAFVGWCTDSALQNCSKTQTIPTKSMGNKTFYAKYRKSTFTINFSAGIIGTTGTVAPITCTYGEYSTCKAPENSFVITTHEFSHWSYKGKKYYPGNDLSTLTATDGASLTLTATWKPKFILEFLPGENCGIPIEELPTQICTYNENNNGGCLAIENPFDIISGRVFTGWLCAGKYCSKYYPTGKINPGDDMSGIHDELETLQIRAVCEDAPQIIYNLSYEAGGGSGTVPKDTYCYFADKDTCTAPGKGNLTKSNYIFAGWRCTQGCTDTETIYKPGDDVSQLTKISNANVVLTAEWTKEYTVKLVDICDTETDRLCDRLKDVYTPTSITNLFITINSKVCQDEDRKTCYGASNNPVLSIPTRKGYNFLGYYDSTQSTILINRNGSIPISLIQYIPEETNVSAYSVWKPITCTTDTYYKETENLITCEPCPENSSNSSDGHTNTTCTCNTGYSLDGTQDGDTTTTSTACAPITYKINYKSNDETISSGTGLPATYTYGTTTQITGVPTNGEDNYVFAGWCTDDALTNCAMTQTITANTTGNKTFYAKWEKRYFNVTYDKGLEYVPWKNNPDDMKCIAGEKCFVAEPVDVTSFVYDKDSNTIYFFTGWMCKQGCDDTKTLFQPGDDISAVSKIHKANIILAAQWTNWHEFTLTDFCDAGRPCDEKENQYTAPIPNPIYLKYGVGLFADKALEKNLPNITTPKRFGYSFDGYYTTTKYTKQFIDQKGAVVNDMLGVYVPDAAKKLYSKWTEIVCNTNQYYKVTGDVVTCASCPANSSNTGAGTGHKRPQCICNTGYNNSSGGNTTTTNPCQPNTYDITYELDGGTASSTGMPTNYTYGVGTTITGTPQKTGYTFNGWCNDPEKLDCYTKGEPIVINTTSMKDITLYASWTVNRFDIRYLSGAEDATGTEPANSNCIYSLPEGCTAPENPYTRTGYKFVAWGYNDDTYAPGTDLSTITTGTNGITMTAIWEPITFSIKYSGNGGTGNNPSAPVSCTYDSECVLPDNPYSLSGNTFKGWKCVGAACANTEKIYSENESISNAAIVDKATITITAVWEPNIYTFTIKPEFYDEEPFDVYLKYGTGWYSDSTAKTPINSLPSLPVRDGFAFLGLYTNDAANIQIVDSEGNFIKTPETLNLIPSGSSIELRDKWSAKPITCEAGTYYPGTEFICSTCPVGSYCPGGIFDTADNTENGKHTCPDSGTTTAGAESIEQCYKANLTFTAVNGSGTQTCYYSEDAQSYTNTCKDITITSCNAGYYFNSDENTQDCVEVGVGYYSTTGSLQRTQCPDGGTTLTSVSTEAGACFKENMSCAIENGSGQNTCNYSVASQSYSNCGTCMVTSCNESYSWVDNSCIMCPANSVCYDKQIGTCSELTGGEYTLSDMGTTSVDMCYKPCEALGDIQEVTGREYLGIESTCQVTRCAQGFYINDNSCEVCPAGSYCDTGLSTYKSCAVLGEWATSDIGAGSMNDCYKTCEPYDVTNGTAVPVKEKVFYPEECQFKGQSETGNPCEIIDGVCIEKSCNGDYEMIDGECVPCEREFAMTYKQEGNCRIDTCVAGYHSRIDYCEPDIQLCEAPNALYAEQAWDKKLNAFGTCKALECQDGYHVAANACVSDLQQCNVENGIGVKEWNHNKNGWDKCVATSCNPGYSNDPAETNERNVQCGECRNKYAVRGELAVSSYVQGCEIAACMYQGERYNLENNECVPICPTEEYEDETGTMVWDESSETCIRTCKDGYVMW